MEQIAGDSSPAAVLGVRCVIPADSRLIGAPAKHDVAAFQLTWEVYQPDVVTAVAILAANLLQFAVESLDFDLDGFKGFEPGSIIQLDGVFPRVDMAQLPTLLQKVVHHSAHQR